MASTPGGVIVGTGFGVLTHLRAMRKAGIDVKALVGRDPARTRARAERVGVEREQHESVHAGEVPRGGLLDLAAVGQVHEPVLQVDGGASGHAVTAQRLPLRGAQDLVDQHAADYLRSQLPIQTPDACVPPNVPIVGS